MILILHNIRSKHNVGSMFRTSDACGGVDMIYLTGYTPSPIDEKGNNNIGLTKVSLGSENFIKWKKLKCVRDLIKRLKNKSHVINSIELTNNAIDYKNISLNHSDWKKTVIIMGNEVDGVDESILKKSNRVIKINMNGQKESLNVSVAYGVNAFGLRPK